MLTEGCRGAPGGLQRPGVRVNKLKNPYFLRGRNKRPRTTIKASQRVPIKGYLSAWALGWHYSEPMAALGPGEAQPRAARDPL